MEKNKNILNESKNYASDADKHLDDPKNEKTQNIKESLAELLNQLLGEKRKFNKLVEFAGGGLPFPCYFDIGSIDKGIHILEKLKFASVNDLASVKKLRQTEFFFAKNDGLKNFKFPDYKSQISPDFLTYVAIEIQLDVFDRKAVDLLHRGYSLAGTEASWVVFNLRNLNQWLFDEKKIDYDNYRSRSLEVINQSRPVLEQHRGYKKLLGNLILLILTLGTAFIINKAVNGHFLFFQKTESAKQLDTISQTLAAVNQLSPQLKHPVPWTG